MPVLSLRTALATGWKWRLANSNGEPEAEQNSSLKNWTEVAHGIPSVAHSELLSSKAIEDYRQEEHERKIQWVGKADWEYSCSFPTPKSTGREIDLVFEGLDTIATVTLNGVEILRSDNQFLCHRTPVREHLKPAGEENNSLSILFESVVKKGAELELKYGKRTSIMRDPARNHFRKSGYHWGWDWGPIILTAGPWKPIFLETYDNRIEDVHIVSDLAPDHKSARLSLTVKTASDSATYHLEATITDQSGRKVIHESLKSNVGDFRIDQPKLWWPNGQGDAHLYSVQVLLIDSSSNETIDSKTLRFGIRKIELVQRPLTDAPGTTFMFSVNGREIFSQGANWIPGDNLLHTMTRQRYYDWIKLARHHHLNMIRVWGGGIYETEDFFDACDELGLLVWHDFAFACGDYPTHPEFLDNVRKEAEAQVLRLRNRSSLALLCGNNEDFMLNDWTEVKYDFQDTTGPFLDKPFPQREIYLGILPSTCKKHCPYIQYWPSSPWGGKNASDSTVGDIHQWTVWHVDQKPYQSYRDISGRFVSEFGMHAFPVERTVKDTYFGPSTPSRLRHAQSSLVDCRNKGHGAETRLARYLAENFRYDNNNLSNWIYSTQLLQSEAYGYAYRDWKRKFAGKGREECAGALVWQFNDVYPTTSWAFVDYYLRPKPAAYTIRRACADLSIGTSRTPRSRWFDEDKTDQDRIPRFEIFGHNMTSQDRTCTMIIKAYDFATGSWTPLEEERQVTLKAGYNTEITTISPLSTWTDESLIILQASLVDSTSKKLLARHVDWPEPYRYLYWPQDTKVDVAIERQSSQSVPGSKEEGDLLDCSMSNNWEEFVTLTSNYPIKGCWLEPKYDGSEKRDDMEPLWEDNMLDLMPGEALRVGVNGLRGRDVKIRFLYDWELK